MSRTIILNIDFFKKNICDLDEFDLGKTIQLRDKFEPKYAILLGYDKKNIYVNISGKKDSILMLNEKEIIFIKTKLN